ncbi:MAG: PIG-L deacetylase family protein [Patescibacteria group bacterium]
MQSNRQKNKNRPVLVAVFAHPDDEAFGPAGTIALYSQTHDIYLLCATKGEEGGKDKKIAQVRQNELLSSANVLGVKKVFFLGFKDGTLCNNLYHKLTAKIEEKFKELNPEVIMTAEPLGVSGHIDHIMVSLATTFVFKKLKFIKTLMYYCIDKKAAAHMEHYFIYFPPGYSKKDVDKVVDISNVWNQKIGAISAHKSQKEDAKTILKRNEGLSKEEYFLILNK